MAKQIKYMAGKYEMSIGDTLIPASLLGNITVDYEEGTVSVETQAGTFTQPSGKSETSEATFTMFLPSFDYLKTLYADIYKAGSGDQKSGNIIFGGDSCTTLEGLPINIHPTCNKTDDDDIHIFSGIIKHSLNIDLSTSDAASIETTIYMQPTEDGVLRIGTGNLTEPSHYDPATQKTVVNDDPEES